MVNLSRGVLSILPLADEKTGRLIERLDGPTRAKLLMALLGLVLVGLALIALAVWGGRFVRRMGKNDTASKPAIGEDWFKKPLAELDDPAAMDESGQAKDDDASTRGGDSSRP